MRMDQEIQPSKLGSTTRTPRRAELAPLPSLPKKAEPTQTHLPPPTTRSTMPRPFNH